MDHNKLWKILQEMRTPDNLTCLLRNLHAGQEVTEPDMKQLTGSKSGKEYVKAVYCYLDYLTSMQSTSCELLGWIKHKLESRLPGEKKTARRNINNLRHADDTTFVAVSKNELNNLLMKVKRRVKKLA